MTLLILDATILTGLLAAKLAARVKIPMVVG